MQTSEEQVILIIVVPQTIKDDLVDQLIQIPFISGFSLFKIQGYSKENSQFNISEQVVGYQDFFRFEIAHQTTQSQFLIDQLSKTSHNKKIRYWLVPVLQQGLM